MPAPQRGEHREATRDGNVMQPGELGGGGRRQQVIRTGGSENKRSKHAACRSPRWGMRAKSLSRASRFRAKQRTDDVEPLVLLRQQPRPRPDQASTGLKARDAGRLSQVYLPSQMMSACSLSAGPPYDAMGAVAGGWAPLQRKPAATMWTLCYNTRMVSLASRTPAPQDSSSATSSCGNVASTFALKSPPSIERAAKAWLFHTVKLIHFIIGIPTCNEKRHNNKKENA